MIIDRALAIRAKLRKVKYYETLLGFETSATYVRPSDEHDCLRGYRKDAVLGEASLLQK